MTDDSLESVVADIRSYKAEQKVFACTSEAVDESCGYGEICICKGEREEAPPMPNIHCPVHGEVTD